MRKGSQVASGVAGGAERHEATDGERGRGRIRRAHSGLKILRDSVFYVFFHVYILLYVLVFNVSYIKHVLSATEHMEYLELWNMESKCVPMNAASSGRT